MRANIVSASRELESVVLVLERLTPLSFEDRSVIRFLPHHVKHIGKGSRLVHAGAIEQECAVPLTAYINKSKLTGDGHKHILALNFPGEVVNAESALSLASDYHADVFKAGDVAFIPAEALRELIFNHSAIARAIWMRSHAEAALAREWILNSRRDLPTRTAHLLCEATARLEKARLGDDSFYIPMDTEELAQALGSVSLYIDRTLASLEERGIIRREIGGIRILNWRGLAAIADFDPLYLLHEATSAS